MDKKENNTQDLKQAILIEPSELNQDDNNEEEVVFAPVTKKSAQTTARVPIQQKEDDEDVILAAPGGRSVEAKNQKSKKGKTIAITASVAAVACIAVIGVVLASQQLSQGQTTVPTVAEASTTSVVAQPNDKAKNVSAEQAIKEVKAQPIEITDVDTKSILFGDNVTVEGVNLSGKTLAQAFDSMQDKVAELKEDINITVNCDGKDMTVTENDFSFDTDISEVLIQAYHFSRGELDAPTAQTITNDGVTDFKVNTALNAKSVDSVVKKIAKKFEIQPVNAHVKKFDPDAKEKFTYADGKNGYLLDHDELKKQINTILEQSDKTGSFSINTKETAYTITLADIKANTKLIASHRTSALNVYASNYNMSLAIKAASGYEVKPGETFSFNKMTGDTTTGDEHHYANGVVGSYMPSTAIVDGGYEQQYGGGICQASTTIYNCAVKADMDIVERHAHQFPSSYAEYGLDATIDYGNLDMKFKNNKKYSVYIATYVYDSNGDGADELNVEMYGPISKDYDEIVAVGWITSANDYDYSARGAKVYFKNGKEVKRKNLPEDAYDYNYDSYSSAVNQMPSNPKKGPSVEPTYSTPAIYSPKGVGSCGPIAYGTAEKVLNDAKKAGTTSKPSTTSTTSETSKASETSKKADD